MIELRVRVWGTTDLRTLQAWIGVNGVQDITYYYGQTQTDPAGQDYLVGAENEIGVGDMTAILPSATTGLVVTSTDPTPGESASYSLTVRGLGIGTGVVTSTMTADGVIGKTVVKTSITIE